MNSGLFRALAGGIVLFTTSTLVSAEPLWTAAKCVATSSQTSNCVATGSAPSATLSAWSAKSNQQFTSAQLVRYGEGFGITAPGETGSPHHAIDNYGATDAILMHFGTDVALNQLTSGWIYNDADVSILRFIGAQPPSLSSYQVGTIGKAVGWEVVGNYRILQAGVPLAFNTGADAKSASWWLVSAYHTGYSGTGAPYGFGNGNDFFKLQSFGGEVAQTPVVDAAPIPEPASLSLLGIAMLGLIAARRKKA